MAKTPLEREAQGYMTGLPAAGAGGMPDPHSMIGVRRREQEQREAERLARNRAATEAGLARAPAPAPAAIGYAEAARMTARAEAVRAAAGMLVAAHRAHLAYERKVGDPDFSAPGSREAALEADQDYRDWVWATWFNEVSPIEALIGQHDPELELTHLFPGQGLMYRRKDALTTQGILSYFEDKAGDTVAGLREAVEHLRNGGAVRHHDRLLRTKHALYPGRGNWQRRPTRLETMRASQRVVVEKMQGTLYARQKSLADRQRRVKAAVAVSAGLALLLAVGLLFG